MVVGEKSENRKNRPTIYLFNCSISKSENSDWEFATLLCIWLLPIKYFGVLTVAQTNKKKMAWWCHFLL